MTSPVCNVLHPVDRQQRLDGIKEGFVQVVEIKREVVVSVQQFLDNVHLRQEVCDVRIQIKQPRYIEETRDGFLQEL